MALHTLWRRSAPRNRFITNAVVTKSNRGFSLIELLVVAAVMVIVSSVVLVNNARFGGVIRLENFAYDVALSIRQAQLYGVSVARFQGGFSSGYGVRINMANPTTYLMFSDAVTQNGLYDCPGAAPNCELVQTSTMSGGYTIKKICVTSSAGVEMCSDQSGTAIFMNKVMDIYFIRPELNAWISAAGIPCNPTTGAGCRLRARIQLRSPKGQTMDVVVEASGQISVQRVAG